MSQEISELHNIKVDVELILGVRCDVDEICGLLGYYVALCGNCLLK
jgi:hypothetical protein